MVDVIWSSKSQLYEGFQYDGVQLLPMMDILIGGPRLVVPDFVKATSGLGETSLHDLHGIVLVFSPHIHKPGAGMAGIAFSLAVTQRLP